MAGKLLKNIMVARSRDKPRSRDKGNVVWTHYEILLTMRKGEVLPFSTTWKKLRASFSANKLDGKIWKPYI